MSDTPITDAVLNCETRCDLHCLSPNFVTTPAKYVAQLTEEAIELRETCKKLERMCGELAETAYSYRVVSLRNGIVNGIALQNAIAKWQEMKAAAK